MSRNTKDHTLGRVPCISLARPRASARFRRSWDYDLWSWGLGS